MTPERTLSGAQFLRRFRWLVFLTWCIPPMRVQYDWTRTGFFSGETFAVWLLLELLAVGGSLMCARGFGQALAPCRRATDAGNGASRVKQHCERLPRAPRRVLLSIRLPWDLLRTASNSGDPPIGGPAARTTTDTIPPHIGSGFWGEALSKRSHERRGVSIALAAGVIAPRMAFAARPTLTLATGALPPLTGETGQPGFLDELLRQAFDRIGIDATVIRVPTERALVNANTGVEDGDAFRAPGFEKDYPDLVQIPEKLLDFDFVAYAMRPDIQVRNWSELAPFAVAYVTGWKIYERNVKARTITTVRELGQLFPLLAKGRADVVLLDRWQGLWVARKANTAARPFDPPLARVAMFAYLNRRHAALTAPAAAALADLKRDGTWQKLYDRILKPLEP